MNVNALVTMNVKDEVDKKKNDRDFEEYCKYSKITRP